jgi:hypothetical protein
MCTVLLPPGVNPIAVNNYINISLSYVNVQHWSLASKGNGHPRTPSELDRALGGQSHTPAALLPGKRPGIRCIGGPQDRSVRVRKTRLPLGFDPQAIEPVASPCTD